MKWLAERIGRQGLPVSLGSRNAKLAGDPPDSTTWPNSKVAAASVFGINGMVHGYASAPASQRIASKGGHRRLGPRPITGDDMKQAHATPAAH